MFPSLDVSTSVVSSALAFSTPLGISSGFLGLGVCFGVEQGARIGILEIPSLGNSVISPPILVELFLLYLLLLLSDFSATLDFFDGAVAIRALWDIMHF